MQFDRAERRFVRRGRVGRLATTDGEGRPHVVPVCYALVDDELVSPLDEKPKSVAPTGLQRVRNVRANPEASLVVDRYVEDWDRLGWVQVHGTAAVRGPDDEGHEAAVGALREKYRQYCDQAIDERPRLVLSPDRVVSWGKLALD